MEGLLPLVFKAIKKNRSRRHYECLSSGISMAEMYPQTQTHNHIPHTHNQDHHHKLGHRRYKSVEDFQPPNTITAVDDSPKLVRIPLLTLSFLLSPFSKFIDPPRS
ncbi:hypothetical protein Fmac_001120 [Flemingia macrophylla]|uniref:Uncharacterized protein n=1 Tax=Flemingia macrophylla TaxID=520843 RepID=A0ABD1NIZ6_9FABA